MKTTPMPLSRTVLATLLAGISASACASSDVVISQVYGGGGNSGGVFRSDFIELFNRSSSDIAIGGWSVQYASSAGTTWQATAIPAGTVLKAGQYYLIQEATGSATTQPALTADLVGTLALSGSNGKVALSGTSTVLSGAQPTSAALKDLVSFGSTAGWEGAAGPALGNALAAMRADEGCIDTDNNASDFTAVTPVPRNTSSAVRDCRLPAAKPIVATCPASLSLARGTSGGAILSATDADGIVSRASITAGAISGITLTGFQNDGLTGGTATVSLSVADTLAVGSYPVTVQFGNEQSQTISCSIAVSVQEPAAVTLSIPKIQGNGATSQYANTIQTTEGVVTLKVATGFFLQDAQGDGDPTTSDGIFVYTGTATNTVKAGDKVRVTGTVQEYTPTGGTRSMTELSSVTAIVPQGTGSVSPTIISLPADLAQYEGMLVQFSQALTVSQLEYVGDRGEVSLSSGRLEIPTNRYPARSAEAIALAADNARNLIVLDDGTTATPNPIPYIGAGDGSLRVGDTTSGITGVVDYATGGGSVGVFKLQPTAAPVFSQDNQRTSAPSLAAGNVKVASANVLNFFTTFTNGSDETGATGQGCALGSSVSKNNCRGADNLAEFIRQRDKIVNELKAMDADVYGLMEIQNSVETTVDPQGEHTVKYLVQALNDAVGVPGTYAYVPKPSTTGTDAIRVAMIYKPAKLTLVGGALTDGDTINNRPPMAQTFRTADGGKFSLIVNHLKSKGSCSTSSSDDPLDKDQGDSQSCWNATRLKQAKRLVNTFVPQVVAAAGDPRVLLIGDFNSYGMEDPIAAITATGYVNQLERYVRPRGMPYSFVFGSTSGYLDHALASAALSPEVADVTEWHVNADEPTVIDYNTDGKVVDLYTALPYRASDHDPVVISLNLKGSYSDVSASVRTGASGLVFNRATGKFTGTFSFTNTGSTALSGPFQVQFDSLTSGITLDNASGTHNGSPYITVSTSQLAPGATVSVPLTFTNPAKVGVSYAAKIYSGTF